MVTRLAVMAALTVSLAAQAAHAETPPESREPSYPPPLEFWIPPSVVTRTPANPGTPVLPLSTSVWTEFGPSPVISGQAPGGGPISGRVSAVAVHPTNGNIIYVGAAGGGVWKTTDGGTTWSPLTDSQPSLETGAIALAPSNPQIVYVGTGEANYSQLSFYGRGILKSTDGGASFTLVGGAAFDRRAISKIVVHPSDPNTLFAASARGVNGVTTGFGVWRSTDGGVSWTNITTAVATDVSFTDLAMDPANPNVLYAGAGPRYGGSAASGLYKTTNALAATPTWTLVGGGLPSGTGLGRVSVAIAPSNNQVLYVVIADPVSQNNVLKFMSSTDAGVTWTDRTATLPGTGQIWYCDALAVDPTDANKVYFGGSTQLVKSVNGGATFASIASGADGKGPHVDHHALVFDSSGRLLDGDDGGIFRYTPATNLWADLNANLATIQFMGVGLNPANPDVATGGTQDNGTLRFFGYREWSLIEGGDGGDVEVDPLSSSTLYRANPVGSFGAGAFFRKSVDGGLSWTANTTGITNSSSGNFYMPFVVDPAVAGRLLLGTNVACLTTNAAASWGRLPGDTFTFPSGPSSTGGTDTGIDFVEVGAATPSTIYASAAGSVYVSTDNGVNWIQRNPAGVSDRFKDVVVDPADSNTAYMVRNRFNPGGHVFRTNNAGVSWTDISANLPDLPANCIVLDANGPGTADDVLYVGMDQGVYKSTNLGASWTPVASGLPNARVVDLELAKGLGILAAATHGRGMWEIAIAPIPGGCCLPDGSCVVTSAADCAGQSGAFRGEGSSCVVASGSPQSFSSTNVPLALADLATTESTLTISGYTGAFAAITVQLNINHTFDQDLQISLVRPDGFSVGLATNIGGGGQNFTNTVFDDAAATPVENGAAPFTGTFRPMGTLSRLTGVSPNGTWKLRVTDTSGGDTGTLNSWLIALTQGVNPCPPPCTGAPPEVQSMTAAADKATYSWAAASSATRYDVVRGSLAAFPVGPGGADETCFDNLAGPTLSDPSTPAPGSGYWYLARGENTCGNGSWGLHSNGSPRTTTTCP